jgi:5-methylcytosine-specific restriction endonuclease McrBC regulatory subunit McrC
MERLLTYSCILCQQNYSKTYNAYPNLETTPKSVGLFKFGLYQSSITLILYRPYIFSVVTLQS